MAADSHAREREVLEHIVETLRCFLKPRKIILFGSRAKNRGGKTSDFDVACDCTKPEAKVLTAISDRMKKVTGLYQVDIVYLPEVDPEFRDVILETGKIVYEQRD